MTQSEEVKRAYSIADKNTGERIASPIQAATIANLVANWAKTRTASFLDDAVIYCCDQGLPILTPLARELADAAKRRQAGKTSRAVQAGVKDKAFSIMANLIMAGATDRVAAGKAAVWSMNTPHPMKASSLEKKYPNVWRAGNPSMEMQLKAFCEENPNPTFENEWRRLLESIPDPSADQRGERR